VIAYNYKAYDQQGTVRKGEIAASDEQSALQDLRALGLLPIAISMTEKRSWVAFLWPRFENKKSLSRAGRERYLSSLATLLHAGFLLSDCHRFLANDQSDKALARFSSDILEKLQRGHTLSVSLRGDHGGMDMAQIAAIAAGEKAGDLIQPLLHIAQSMKASNANRDKLTSALIYPLVLVLTSVVSIVVVASVLVPNLLPIFEGRESELPAAMRILVALKAFFADHFALIVIFVLGLALIARQLASNVAVQTVVHNTKRKVGFVRKLEAARIAGSIGLMLRGGTSILDATRTCGENERNAILSRELLMVTEEISEGKPFRDAARQITAFTPIDLQMLSLAEQANRLEVVLDHIAKTNDADATRQLERLMGLLTPFMTLLMGLLIGGLIYSVMRSILSINQLVQ
jgi:general secretion pathway protein F